jgi:tetratricopeptide (TPR) repeat protein
MTKHPDPDEITAYALDPDRVADRAAFEAHIEDCAQCAGVLADYRLLNDALRKRETWAAADALLGEDSARDSIAEAAAVAAAEDAEAAELLQPILAAPGQYLWADLVRDPRYHTAGVVRLLCREARELFEREPLDAAERAYDAALIAESIPDDRYPIIVIEELRGTAWKEYANACRYLGRFREAHDALDRAEAAYRRLPEPDLLLCNVRYVRATVLQKSERWEEAAAMARECARQYAGLGQTMRYVHSKLLESVVVARLGQLGEAESILQRLLDTVTTDDVVLRARLLMNLGNIHLERGELNQASVELYTALRVWEDLGVTTEALKVRWRLAYMLLASGRAEEAIPRLEKAMDECTAHGMLADAALVLLDRAEAFLVTGRLWDVTTCCTALAGTFREAGMLTAHLTALAYLRESARSWRVSHDLIRYLRQFFHRLQDRPDLLFVPPSE